MYTQGKKRNSSVELFRILAMLFVVIVHYNGWLTGGMADHFDQDAASVHSVTQATIQGMTAVCVNCFLVITGYYGVKFKGRTFWNMWVLLVCIYVPCEILMQGYHGEIHPMAFVDDILAFTRESYYVQCYLMLVFLSPILNSFIEKYDKKILPYVLMFWGIEFVMDWGHHNHSLGFEQGYGLIHFVLMYMLGRTAALYKDKITSMNINCFRGGYFICCLLMALSYIAGLSYDRSYCYSNPLNIVGSFCLFFLFLRRNYYNKWINKVAASTFSVYILHTCAPMILVIGKIDVYTLSHYSYGLYLLIGAGVIASVYIIGTLYDWVRIAITHRVSDHIYQWLSKKIKINYI